MNSILKDNSKSFSTKNHLNDELDNNYLSKDSLQTEVPSNTTNDGYQSGFEDTTQEEYIPNDDEFKSSKRTTTRRQGAVRWFFNMINIFRRKEQIHHEGSDEWVTESESSQSGCLEPPASRGDPNENTESDSEPYFDPLQYPRYNSGKMNHNNLDLCQCKYCCSINYEDLYHQSQRQEATRRHSSNDQSTPDSPLLLDQSERRLIRSENAENNNVPNSVNVNRRNNEDGVVYDDRYMNLYNGLDNFIQEWGEADRDFRCQTYILDSLLSPFFWTFKKIKKLWKLFSLCSRVRVHPEKITQDEEESPSRDDLGRPLRWCVNRNRNRVERRASCDF